MFSVNIMWNCRGSRKAAQKDKNMSVVHGPSRIGAYSASRPRGVRPPSVHPAYAAEDAEQREQPTMHKADSLTSDSKAIATTRPSCFSAGDMCARQTESRTGSGHAESPRPGYAGCASWVRICTDSVTARICSAMYGKVPHSMNSVTSTPAVWLRNLNANTSASEVS